MAVQRNVKYSDGTPSREVEDDWEATGNEDLLKLERALPPLQQVNPVRIRDHLNCVNSLIKVCSIALLNREWNSENGPLVANVMFDYIRPELELIEQELQQL